MMRSKAFLKRDKWLQEGERQKKFCGVKREGGGSAPGDFPFGMG